MPRDDDHPLPTIRPAVPDADPPDTVPVGDSPAPPPAAGPAPPGPAAPPGFEMGAEIGRGGMGVVYSARDVEFGREVAVKLLRPEYRSDPAAGRRFVEEARITGQLQHPGIPAAYRVGITADGTPFLAMKLVRGRTLHELVKASGGDEPRRSLVAAFEGVCRAVGYAHAHRVVHRDLKPHNVMVGAFGEVQVMDWGLAKVLASVGASARRGSDDDDPDAVHSDRDESDATRAGSVLGTPAYMPPEQALGDVDRLDARSDVFGLGAVLCAVLTGLPPYTGGSVERTRRMAAAADQADAFARLAECGADAELVALCKRCLSPDPADRPADGNAVADAVAAFQSGLADRLRRAELEAARRSSGGSGSGSGSG